MGDFFIQPIDRQRVLNEVVGADAEKLHPFGEAAGGQRCGRDFDHRAGLQVLVERDVFVPQLSFVNFDQGVGLVEFIQAGDHGIHYLDVASSARTQDGAELVPKDLALLQAKPDRAPAEERIHLLRHLQMGEKFVTA